MVSSKIRRSIASIVVLSCSITAVCPVYASPMNTSMEMIQSQSSIEGNDYQEKGTYISDGINYEYSSQTLYDGTINMERYIIDSDGNKTFYDNYSVANNGVDEVYFNNELAVQIGNVTQDSEASTFEIYPPVRKHGEFSVNYTNKDEFQVAHLIATAVKLHNPFVIIGEGLLLMIASDALDRKAENVHFEEISQLETWPTNVPPGYTGAITRIDYEYSFYNGAFLIDKHQLGDTVYGTYYGMP